MSVALETRPVHLTPTDEKLLAAAFACGFTQAYGYIGGMGHFIPTVIGTMLIKSLDEQILGVEDEKITCDGNGEWKFAQ
jgi:hypothetical protein